MKIKVAGLYKIQEILEGIDVNKIVKDAMEDAMGQKEEQSFSTPFMDGEKQAEYKTSDEICRCGTCKNVFMDGYESGYKAGHEAGAWAELEARAAAGTRPMRKGRKYWRERAKQYRRYFKDSALELEECEDELRAVKELLAIREEQLEGELTCVAVNAEKLKEIRRIYKSWRRGTHETFSHSHNAMVDVGAAIGISSDQVDPAKEHREHMENQANSFKLRAIQNIHDEWYPLDTNDSRHSGHASMHQIGDILKRPTDVVPSFRDAGGAIPHKGDERPAEEIIRDARDGE